MARDVRWVCMGVDTMADGSCDCEVWIDSFTHRGYGVSMIRNDGQERIFVVTLRKDQIEPVTQADGMVPSFETREAARQFLFAHVQQ